MQTGLGNLPALPGSPPNAMHLQWPRVLNKDGFEEDYDNFLLMHAMGANAAGQVASVVAGGILLALVVR